MNNIKRITGLYRKLLLFNLVMLVIIIALYPEQFSLLRDPLSWLGKAGPGEGWALYSSFWLFAAALLFNIFRFGQIIYLLAQTRAREKPLVRIASLMVPAGFLLMLFPCDRFDPAHSTGGSLVGIAFWVISTVMLVCVRSNLNAGIYFGLHAFLHCSAIYCIINFALDTALKGFSQRPAILVILAVTNICLHLMQKEGKLTYPAI